MPRQRLGRRIIIPNKTKGYLGRQAACLRGTERRKAGVPEDRRPPIMFLVYANERQRASVECVCVCEKEWITCQESEQEDKDCDVCMSRKIVVIFTITRYNGSTSAKWPWEHQQPPKS